MRVIAYRKRQNASGKDAIGNWIRVRYCYVFQSKKNAVSQKGEVYSPESPHLNPLKLGNPSFLDLFTRWREHGHIVISVARIFRDMRVNSHQISIPSNQLLRQAGTTRWRKSNHSIGKRYNFYKWRKLLIRF